MNKLLRPFIFLAGASLSLSVGAQTIRGSLDFVDSDTILGWACVQGNPVTKLPVEVYAFDTIFQRWNHLGTETADRDRLDIGNSGICGSGTGASFHGFEYTILPESIIASRSRYQIYAYARNGSALVQLPGTGTVDFSTRGLPTSSIWRTDYNDPAQRVVSMVSCIWPYKGANKNEMDDKGGYDRLFLNAGATSLNPWYRYVPFAPGVAPDAPAIRCIQNDRNNPGNWAWNSSNSATNSTTSWPTDNYWVVSANNEFAYSRTQSGPPGQSEPINVNGMYSVNADANGFQLGIRNYNSEYTSDDTPFLSVGAAMGRGVSGPIAWIEPGGMDTYLELDITEVSRSTNLVDFHDIAIYVEMMWGGYKRFIGISPMQFNLQHQYHWNWNALESFWFPGGEFVLLGTDTIKNACKLPGAKLPKISPDVPLFNRPKHELAIPLRGLLQCIDSASMANLFDQAPGALPIGWAVTRPTNLPIAITGVHMAVEQGPNRSASHMETYFSKPRLIRRN